MEKLLTRNENIIWRKIGDEIVLLKNDGLAVHVLNKTAAHIWEKCDGKSDIDTIAASLCDRFEVTADEARGDILDTVQKLEGMGLVTWNGG